MTGNAVAKVGRVAVDMAKIGASFIPLAGGAVTEIISVLDDRRVRRAERLRNRLIAEIGERLAAAEERLKDERFADLLDDAFERASRTRNEDHIDLIARVVADALCGNVCAGQLDQHHLLVRMAAELLPSHFVVLAEMGTQRESDGTRWGPYPSMTHQSTVGSLSRWCVELSDLMHAVVGDLLAAGLVMYTPLELTANDDPARRNSLRQDPPMQLTGYGLWVLGQLKLLAAERVARTDSE